MLRLIWFLVKAAVVLAVVLTFLYLIVLISAVQMYM